MSEPTKKRHTKDNLFPSLTFNYEGQSYLVKNVSKEKFHEILKISKQNEQMIYADDLIKETIDKLPGDPDYKSGGFFLKQMRLRDELTQKELSKKLGIKRSNISSMERGLRPIGKQLAKKLAAQFGTHYKMFL